MTHLMRTRIAALALLYCPLAQQAAEAPPGVSACLGKAGIAYIVNRKLDAYVLGGDFDGDGKPDLAVAVVRGGQQGIAICRSGAATPVVLGAGTAFNDMANLDFTAWRLHPQKVRVARGFGGGRPPVLTGDALLLEWESASALVYWNGRRFAWYQQGD
jgi:FG-GAP repeat